MDTLSPLGVFGPTEPDPFRLDPADLRPLRNCLPPDVRANVAKYLRSGTIIIAIMEYTEDVLGSEFGVSGGSAILSDGTFYWRGDAAEYVARYGIDVGAAAIEHMRRQAWVAPKLTLDRIAEVDAAVSKILRRGF